MKINKTDIMLILFISIILLPYFIIKALKTKQQKPLIKRKI